MRKVKLALIAMLIVLTLDLQAADRQEADLSFAEKAIVEKKIAALRGQADRRLAEGWTNSKKVAELICRPAALPVIRKQAKSADRVFLGMGTPDSLTLERNDLLTGAGQYRTPQGWKEFRFTCKVNAETGKVTSFEAVPRNDSH